MFALLIHHGLSPLASAGKPMPQAERPEPHIYLDQSGDLRAGFFYQVSFDEEMFLPPKAGDGEVLQFREPPEELLLAQGKGGYFYTQFETGFELEFETVRGCRVDPDHVTQSWWRDLKVMVGNGLAPPFVALTSDKIALLIRPDLLEDLRSSGLTGWQVAEVVYAFQDSTVLGTTRKPNEFPEMWYFQFRGQARLRSKSFRNTKNECPHCGHGIIYCPGCRYRTPECEKCGQIASQTQTAAMRPDVKMRRGPLIEEDDKELRRGILEGEDWDGSDFIQIGCGWPHGPFADDRHIITKRALDWLVARHAAPLWAQPVPVDVSRMTDAQREKLEQATQPPIVK